jgi:hypothetical protein
LCWPAFRFLGSGRMWAFTWDTPCLEEVVIRL